ncbi:hypothetical protein PG275_10300 [Riemerella anatipestifer]|uniref:hypothetical protein n=1 Tax=Riemerella anatipestifer TaxID=34085 RepID=UPI002A883318|nr:hypothetical protein [Riemerella anatipestifer]
MTVLTFTALRISNKENILFPDKISIDDQNVEYYKGQLIGYEKMSIRRNNISSIIINSGLLFSNIIIQTFGGGYFQAIGFSNKDAKTIESILK